MKSKMAALLEENEKLHSEIQRGIMTGILDNEVSYYIMIYIKIKLCKIVFF